MPWADIGSEYVRVRLPRSASNRRTTAGLAIRATRSSRFGTTFSRGGGAISGWSTFATGTASAASSPARLRSALRLGGSTPCRCFTKKSCIRRVP